MAHFGPTGCSLASSGRRFSWVPQPSSEGCSPSLTKPWMLQVLTNSSSFFGTFATWVSRSATWIVLRPISMASRAQPSRVVGSRRFLFFSRPISIIPALTKWLIRPGLAPMVTTMVGDPFGHFFAISLVV